MVVVNRFNVNKEQVTLDADIIENMSANDVSYDASTQYDENTVGEKLSELEKKSGHIEITSLPTNSDLYFTDESGNVLLFIKDGHIYTAKFNTRNIAKKIDVSKLDQDLTRRIEEIINTVQNKQDKGNYVGVDTTRSKDGIQFVDEQGNSIMTVIGGQIMTKGFDSRKALAQTSKSGMDVVISDELSNVVALIRNGDIRTKHFDSKAIRVLVDATYNRLVNLEKDDTLLKRKEIPAISWIDDDFDTVSSKLPMLNRLHDWCVSHNIRADIALIPDVTTHGTGADIVIDDVYFKEERLQMIEQWRNEGFDFLVHPHHTGLYTGGGWNVVGSPEYIRKNIALTIKCFRENNLNPNILIYPGASNGTPTVVECAKKFFDCAFWAGGGAVMKYRNRHMIERVPLNISVDNTVSQIKQQIKDAVDIGKWVVFMSHCWMHSGDGTEPTDETTMSFSNLFDIITYANSLCPIKGAKEVWRERSILWDYYN